MPGEVTEGLIAELNSLLDGVTEDPDGRTVLPHGGYQRIERAAEAAIAALSAQQAREGKGNLAALRKIAEAAARAAPGEWEADRVDSEDGRGGCYAYAVFSGQPYYSAPRTSLVDTHNSENALMEHDDGKPWDENGRRVCEHIAAFDPPTALALLDRLAAPAIPAPDAAQATCPTKSDKCPASDAGGARAAAKKLLQDICACAAESDSLDLPHVIKDCIEPLEKVIAERDLLLKMLELSHRFMDPAGPFDTVELLRQLAKAEAALNRAPDAGGGEVEHDAEVVRLMGRAHIDPRDCSEPMLTILASGFAHHGYPAAYAARMVKAAYAVAKAALNPAPSPADRVDDMIAGRTSPEPGSWDEGALAGYRAAAAAEGVAPSPVGKEEVARIVRIAIAKAAAVGGNTAREHQAAAAEAARAIIARIRFGGEGR